jgi:uncharacterized protein
MNGLRIYIEDVPFDGLHVEGELGADLLGLSDGEFVESHEALRYSLDVSLVSGEFLVFGSLAVKLRLMCSRCSVMFDSVVEEPQYSFNVQVEKNCEYVDLTADVREAIILAFSSYPVCSEECKGLCAQCGANLNDGECGCAQAVDERWAGLDGLR